MIRTGWTRPKSGKKEPKGSLAFGVIDQKGSLFRDFGHSENRLVRYIGLCAYKSMTIKSCYEVAKKKLLTEPGICEPNRALFTRFFEYLEYKLKRLNRLAELDEASYKTLSYYIYRLRTVNRWFENKPWVDLTKEDIKEVYDGVEDGKIRTKSGKIYRGTEAYFRRVMRGKPFDLAGKRELARSVMEFYQPRSQGDVRFIREPTFRQIIGVVRKPEHKLLLWLAWDIGENGHSLLQLRKRDFSRQVNRETGQAEYVINLQPEILKRSRTPRAEVTNYAETVELLDFLLGQMTDDQLLFSFGHRMAAKALDRAVRLTAATCIPGGQKVTLKDLRSSMACDLLSKGWTTDEVNYRLGHKPSSREIDKYVSWLALDQRRPKKRMFDSNLNDIQNELEESKRREKLTADRLRRQQEEMDLLKEQLAGISEMVKKTTNYTVGVSKVHENIKQRLALKEVSEIS